MAHDQRGVVLEMFAWNHVNSPLAIWSIAFR
jgi:hypothetical protein